MSLEHFEQGWSDLLRDFPPRTYVVVAATSGEPYVQAAGTGDQAGVQAEASGRDLPSELQRSFSAAGFRFDGEYGLWRREIEWPSRSAVYAEAARLCVQSLQSQGVTDAHQLVYWAWRDPEPMDEGRTYSPEERDQLDPGAEDVEFGGLGIAYRRLDN